MSKIKAKLISSTKGLLIFESADYTSLKDGEFYTVDIKPYKTSRSLESNSKLWASIQELAFRTGNEPMDIYIAALEHANVKYEWIAALEEAEDSLKTVYRAVKPQGIVTTEDNKQLVRYKCWIGSSKFDQSEMCRLIDYVERKLYEY